MKRIIPTILIVLIVAMAGFGAFAGAPEHAFAQTPEGPKNFCELTKSDSWSRCLSYLFYLPFVELTAPLTYIAGQVFNYSVAISMSSTLLRSSFVDEGWKIIRNVANMAFIFILIYIAIMTILSLNEFGTYRLLVMLIVVALLVNFSLFAARVVIDVSNIAALEFYNKIQGVQSKAPGPSVPEGQRGGLTLLVKDLANSKDLAGYVLAGLGQNKLLDVNTYKGIFDSRNENNGFFQNFAMLVTLFIFFGIINLVAAGVFLAGAFLFVGRIVALWLVMIFAPLGFIAMILPRTRGYATMWWNTLLSQAFLAPVFIFLFFIFILFLYGGTSATGFVDPSKGFAGTLLDHYSTILQTPPGDTTGERSNPVSPFWVGIAYLALNFAIVIIFLTLILQVSKSLSAHFGEKLVGWSEKTGKWATGFAGRNTIGRVAYLGANNNVMRWAARRSPRLAGALYGGLSRTAKFGFGSQKGFSDAVKTQQERTKGLVDFATEKFEGTEKDEAKKRMYKKIGQPLGGLSATPFIPGQQLLSLAVSAATSTGAKKEAAAGLKILEKKTGEIKGDLSGAAERFNKVIDRLDAELVIPNANDKEKFSAERIRSMNKQGLKALAQELDRRIDMHENDHAPQLEARRIEARDNNDYTRMAEVLALEKANGKAVAAMKELKNTIKTMAKDEKEK